MADYKKITLSHCRQDGSPYIDADGNATTDGVPIATGVFNLDWVYDDDVVKAVYANGTKSYKWADFTTDNQSIIREHFWDEHGADTTMHSDDCLTVTIEDIQVATTSTPDTNPTNGDVFNGTVDWTYFEWFSGEQEHNDSYWTADLHESEVDEEALDDFFKVFDDETGAYLGVNTTDSFCLLASSSADPDGNANFRFKKSGPNYYITTVGNNNPLPPSSLGADVYEFVEFDLDPEFGVGDINISTNEWKTFSKTYWAGLTGIKNPIIVGGEKQDRTLDKSPQWDDDDIFTETTDDIQVTSLTILEYGEEGRKGDIKVRITGKVKMIEPFDFDLTIEQPQFRHDVATGSRSGDWMIVKNTTQEPTPGGVDVPKPPVDAQYPLGQNALPAAADCECGDPRFYNLRYRRRDVKGCSGEAPIDEAISVEFLYHEAGEWEYMSIKSDELPEILTEIDTVTGNHVHPRYSDDDKYMNNLSTPQTRYYKSEPDPGCACAEYEFEYIDFDEIKAEITEDFTAMLETMTRTNSWPEKYVSGSANGGLDPDEVYCCGTRLDCYEEPLGLEPPICAEFWRKVETGAEEGFEDNCSTPGEEGECIPPTITSPSASQYIIEPKGLVQNNNKVDWTTGILTGNAANYTDPGARVKELQPSGLYEEIYEGPAFEALTTTGDAVDLTTTGIYTITYTLPGYDAFPKSRVINVYNTTDHLFKECLTGTYVLISFPNGNDYTLGELVEFIQDQTTTSCVEYMGLDDGLIVYGNSATIGTSDQLGEGCSCLPPEEDGPLVFLRDCHTGQETVSYSGTHYQDTPNGAYISFGSESMPPEGWGPSDIISLPDYLQIGDACYEVLSQETEGYRSRALIRDQFTVLTECCPAPTPTSECADCSSGASIQGVNCCPEPDLYYQYDSISPDGCCDPKSIYIGPVDPDEIMSNFLQTIPNTEDTIHNLNNVCCYAKTNVHQDEPTDVVIASLEDYVDDFLDETPAGCCSDPHVCTFFGEKYDM
jgi:hypothetical protein